MAHAQETLATARATWPDNPEIKRLGGLLAARYGDPNKTGPLDADAASDSDHFELRRLELAIRRSSSPADVAKATQLINKLFKGEDNANAAAQSFMIIGRIDEAYAAVARADGHVDDFSTNLFFAPYAFKFRADPRFMPLMKKIGLLKIWRTSGWPDFCRAPDAPYNCATVAAKLAA